jgi:hypothetical protein
MLVYMGSGADRLYMANMDVQGELILQNAYDIYLHTVQVGGDMSAYDISTYNLFEGHSLDVSGHAHLGYGTGGVTSETITVRGANFGSLDVYTGAGVDAVTLQNVTITPGGHMHVNTGDHRDHVLLDGVQADSLFADLGAGNDHIEIYGSAIGDIDLWTRKGNDSVLIDKVVADELFADLGNGDDRMEVYNSTIRRSLNVSGGEGKDRLVLYLNSLAEVEGDEFESIIRKDGR